MSLNQGRGKRTLDIPLEQNDAANKILLDERFDVI